MAENPPKRQKTSESEEKIECDAMQNFKGFKIKRILNQNLTSKSVFLLGNLYTESSPGSAGDASSGTPEGGVACDDEDPQAQSSGDDQAVVLLEKTAFTEDLLPTLMSEKSVLNRSMQNDIYGVYECFPPKELSGKSNSVANCLIIHCFMKDQRIVRLLKVKPKSEKKRKKKK